MPLIAYIALPIQLDEDIDTKHTFGSMAGSCQSRQSIVSSTVSQREEEIAVLLGHKLGVDPSTLTLHSFTHAHLTPSQSNSPTSPTGTDDNNGVAGLTSGSSEKGDELRSVAFLSTEDCMTLLSGMGGGGSGSAGADQEEIVVEQIDSNNQNGSEQPIEAGKPNAAEGQAEMSVGESTFCRSTPSQSVNADKSGEDMTPRTNSSNATQQRVQELESENALLKAELEDLRAKVEEINAFKVDVLDTIKGMKREVASIGEEVLLGDACDDDDDYDEE